MHNGSLKGWLAASWSVLVLYASLKWIAEGDTHEQAREAFLAFVQRDWSWTGFLQACLGHTLTLLGLAAAAWLAWRVGQAFARWLKLTSSSVALHAVLGLGLTSMTLEGLALVGLWFPLVFLGAGAMMVLTARGSLKPVLTLPPLPSRSALWLVAAGIALAFVGARVPLTNHAVDALLYHFAAPEHFLAVHKFTPVPWQGQVHLPPFVEMLYGPAFALGGTEGAKAVNFLLLLLGGGLILWLCDRAREPSTGWWAYVWYLSLGQVLTTVWQSKNDLGGVVYLLAFTGALWRALEGRGRSWWILGGLCAGWTVVCKAQLAVCILAGVAATCWLKSSLRHFWKPASLAVAAGALPVLAWLVQNVLWVGDPLYPHGLAWVGGTSPWRTPEVASAHYHAYTLFAQFHPSAWLDLLARAGASSWLPIGSLGLACLVPWLFLSPAGSFEVRWLRAVVLAGTVGLQLISAVTRYLLATTVLLCVLLGLHLSRLPGLGPRLRGVLAAASFGLTLTAVGFTDSLTAESWLRFAGQMSRETYLRAELTSFHLLKTTLKRVVKPGERALFVGEARHLELPCRVMAPNVFAVSPVWKWSREASSPAELRKKYRQFGITAVVYNPVTGLYQVFRVFPGLPWKSEQFKLYRQFFETYATLVESPPLIDLDNGSFYVWRLDRRPHPPTPLLAALPGTEGMFSEPIRPHALRGKIGAEGHAEVMEALRAFQPAFEGIGIFHETTAHFAQMVRDDAQAASEYEKALRCGYISENSVAKYAMVCLRLGRLNRAAELLKIAHAVYAPGVLNDVQAMYHVTFANQALRVHRLHDVARHLDLALAAQPKASAVFIAISMCYRKVEAYGSAQEAARKAYAVDPDNPQVQEYWETFYSGQTPITRAGRR